MKLWRINVYGISGGSAYGFGTVLAESMDEAKTIVKKLFPIFNYATVKPSNWPLTHPQADLVFSPFIVQ